MSVSQPRYRADLSYSEPITADKLTVKFDGVLYQVEKDARGGYGNSGLGSNAGTSGLPFYIVRGDGVNGVFTTSAGQHTIEISENTSKIETSECFKKAVRSVSSMMLKYFNGEIQGATWQEAFNALQGGTMVFLNSLSNILPCSYFGVEKITFGITYVDNDGVYTEFYAWNPDGTVAHDSAKYPQS